MWLKMSLWNLALDEISQISSVIRKFYSVDKMGYGEFFRCQYCCLKEKTNTKTSKDPQKIPALHSIVLSRTNWALSSCFHQHVLSLLLGYWVAARLKLDDSRCLLTPEKQWDKRGTAMPEGDGSQAFVCQKCVWDKFYKISAFWKALGHICSIASFVFRKYSNTE